MVVRPIPGFENYSVDKAGNVFSIKRNKFLKPGISGNTHKYFILTKDGKSFKKYAHRLVLETYCGPCPKGFDCCHKDGNPLNNNLENLRWDSRSNNIKDTVAHGNHPMASKTSCKRGHVLSGKNLIRHRSKRECRSCSNALKYLSAQVKKGRINSYSESKITELAQIYYDEMTYLS